MVILYFHGFNSPAPTDKAEKFEALIKRSIPDAQVIVLLYDSANLNDEIPRLDAVVENCITEYDVVGFMGSSLGGFIAQHMARKFERKMVLINPCLNPQELLKTFVGTQPNHTTGGTWEFTTESFSEIGQYVPKTYNHEYGALILLDEGDDVVDHELTIKAYSGRAEVLEFPGGSHRFDHMREASPHIREFLQAVWL